MKFLLGTVFFIFSVNLNVTAAVLPEVQSKLDPFLVRDLKTMEMVSALVIMKVQADVSPAYMLQRKSDRGRFVYNLLTKTALETQNEIIQILNTQQIAYQQHYLINSVFIKEISLELANQLAARADVSRVISNPLVQTPQPIIKKQEIMRSAMGIEPSLIYLGVDRVWNELNVKGSGITVSGQDTGVDWKHPAMVNHYRGNTGKVVDHTYNWHDAIHSQIAPEIENPCGYNTTEPCDDHNHGTHSLGTVVGSDGGQNLIGIAPDAKWIACRNMDAGFGSPNTYLECFEYFLAPYPHNGNAFTEGDPEKAPHVMNNSWGCPETEGCHADEFINALKALKAAGIFVVVSAGNDGPSCKTINAPPAWHIDETFTVGAMSHATGKIAYFSSRGPSSFDGKVGPHVAAPGVNIRSAVRGGRYEGGWSGTSMAGPHVAGVIALMWSANPELVGEIDLTAELLKKTSMPTPATASCGEDINATPNNTYGYGIINAYEAVKAAKEFNN